MNDWHALLDLINTDDGTVLSLGEQKPGGKFKGGKATVAQLRAMAEPPRDRNYWVGLVALDPASGHTRGTADDAVNILGVWADLDAKPDGCGDMVTCGAVTADVAAILDSEPTYTVRSGHGLQPVWLMDDDGTSVAVQVALLSRFGVLVGMVAEKHGVKVDDVWDAARLLRAPGGMNHKEAPVQVGFSASGAERLTWSALRDSMDAYGVPEAESPPNGKSVQFDPEWFTPGEPCRATIETLVKWKDALDGGRHPAARDGQTALARLGEQGHEGTARALETLHQAFLAAARRAGKGQRNPQQAEAEWQSALGGVHLDGATKTGDKGCCGGPAGGRPPSTAGRLVALVRDRFRIGRTSDDRVFLVELDGANVALMPGDAKRRLAARLRAETGAVAGRKALDDAWAVIEGDALMLPKEVLAMRVAMHDGAVLIDLGHGSECLRVSAHGVSVLPRSPVTFRRSRATAAMPMPDLEHGDIAPLWLVVNVDADRRDIVTAWLVAALLRNIPHPILMPRGEMGAAKTTAAVYVSRLIDPCAVQTLSPPKDEERWIGSANARWMMPVDNVSKIEPWWSDALCRTVTGSGDLKRTLYTDDDVIVRLTKGVVILNGISLSSALRSDLAERLLPLDLVRPERYRTEQDIAADFDAVHARILGGLLLIAAEVLAAMPTTPKPTDLRMADFAHVLAAYDAARGTDTLGQYRQMHDDAADDAYESDHVAQAVARFMAERQEWSGTAKELLEALDSPISGVGDYWPSDATRMSGALSRSAPLLKRKGVTVGRRRESSRRLIVLSRVARNTSS